MEKTVTVCLGLVSHRGPDKDVFEDHYRFMHYLGRLQERSYWFNLAKEINPPKTLPKLLRSDEDTGELKPDDPIFEFVTSAPTGNSLVGQARDIVCRRTLDCGADYVLFWDDDMAFPRDSFLRLWRHQKPVVGALAFTSRAPIAPVLYNFRSAFNFSERREDIGIDVILDYPKDRLMRLDGIGTGLVLIDSSVFRKIPEPWFNGSLSHPRIGCGEDIFFAVRCHKAGIPIFCDTSVKTLHKPSMAEQWHGEELYLSQKEKAAEFYKERVACY